MEDKRQETPREREERQRERADRFWEAFRFTENGNAFLIMEVFCHYVIEQECWRELSAEDTNDVKLPKRLINNLVAIAISTARGALCAKTENTPFSKFFLPVIMITPEKGEDLMIMKQSANEE